MARDAQVVAPAGPVGAAWRLWAAGALLLLALSVVATERYAASYETLPLADWLEAHPPFAEDAGVPTSYTLAQWFAMANPELSYRAALVPWTPQFAPPNIFARAASGVRDGAQLELSTSPTGDPTAADPSGADVVLATLQVAVYHRAARASAWAELEAAELDLHDAGYARFRVTGPDEPDRVWVARPGDLGPGHGGAMVLGRRGVVAYLLDVRVARPSQFTWDVKPDLTARVELIARRLVQQWGARLDAAGIR